MDAEEALPDLDHQTNCNSTQPVVGASTIHPQSVSTATLQPESARTNEINYAELARQMVQMFQAGNFNGTAQFTVQEIPSAVTVVEAPIQTDEQQFTVQEIPSAVTVVEAPLQACEQPAKKSVNKRKMANGILA